MPGIFSGIFFAIFEYLFHTSMKFTSALSANLIIGSLAIITSCSKSTTGPVGQTGATGPAGPVLTGNISGYVILTDQYGSPVTTNLKSAYVLLFDAHSGSRLDSVYADSTGLYNLSNVGTGTYTMIAKMAGFGNCVHQNVTFAASTLNIDSKLSAIPDFNVNSVDSIRYKVSNNSVNIYGKITPDPHQRTLLVFVGNANNVSANPADYVFVSGQAVGENAGTYDIAIGFNSFANSGYVSGNTVYFAIYGASNNYSNGDFTDYPTGRIVYTAIGTVPFMPPPSYTLP